MNYQYKIPSLILLLIDCHNIPVKFGLVES